MAHESLVHNPFILMTNPEVVIAAIERSERLGQLNRQLCRPLDRPAVPANGPTANAAGSSTVRAIDVPDARDPADPGADGDDTDLAD